MAKKIEDMIVSDRRKSIRDIPIPEGRRRADRVASIDAVKRTPPVMRVDNANDDEPEESAPIGRAPIPRHRRGSRKRLWYSVIAAVVILLFAGLSFFDGATLSYVPKSAMLNFAGETYTAHKSGDGGLFYSVVKLSRDKGLSAPAGSEENVSRKASGTIVIYNNTAESQRLIANTRFESPSGKIYRIQNPITIPAKKGDQPGSIEAMVYADVAGDSYNSGLTDFTIPGFKGTPRFTTVYARSKTQMAGGFVGKEKVVKPEDLTKTKAEIQAALKEELYAEAQAEVPEDFILFRTLSTFNFEDLPQSAATDGSITVNQRGQLYAVMFSEGDFAKYLGQKKLSIPAADKVALTSFDGLEVSFATTPPADLLSLNEISFKVNGSAQLVWVTDEVAVRADLLGRGKKEVASILGNYPTISSASVTVRPFWKSSLPKEAEKIKIIKLKAE